ncbi:MULTISPECIES: hypothetical protein [unclassified Streptomyces]|uniref:hypothetical protein n=1 Tax=unclassified Streptomyces TaxID=2593676 RepID=UPI002E807EDC|nr:hypothetical protein [Streptomyces sp. NBC_00589]WTI35647.1 hypothetical protein OIC96_11870 [Streptomyces sp. NBC_00775]WUB30679.1 hypothetical protein OHA51_37860 [Streptomyces sp. NBC_00589]
MRDLELSCGLPPGPDFAELVVLAEELGYERRLLEHIDLTTMVGAAARVARQLSRLADAGFREVVHTPAGPDVARELRAFAAAHRQRTER